MDGVRVLLHCGKRESGRMRARPEVAADMSLSDKCHTWRRLFRYPGDPGEE